MSSSGEILFFVCGIFAVISATLTVTLRTPLRAAMALLAHVVSLAGLYLTLHAHLLAAIQLLVYAGAIVVLFVFVIMLMGPGAMDTRSDTRGWVVKTFGAGVLVLVAGAIAFSVGEASAITIDLSVCTAAEAQCEEFGGVEALSHAIFRKSAIPFELVSVLLLVAILAAITVARGRASDEKGFGERIEARKLALRPFPEDPAGPPLNPAVPIGPRPERGEGGEPSGAP
jgi:NADH-quinone oxidoreductase subunit J